MIKGNIIIIKKIIILFWNIWLELDVVFRMLMLVLIEWLLRGWIGW